jgi:Icc-related predicted phosphoesterase
MNTLQNKGIIFAILSVCLLFGCSNRILKVAHVCDPQLGFGNAGFQIDSVCFEQTIRQINDLSPDLVLIAGDLVHNLSDEHAVATILEQIGRIKVPVMLTPGNHDLPDPVTEEGLKNYRTRFGDDFNTRVFKGYRIISANSQLWRVAPVEECVRHEKKLYEALQDAKKRKQPVILLTHVPPFITDIDEQDGYFNLPQAKRKEILSWCEENGVIIWLAGHTHTTLQRTYNGIAILNGETTGKNFDKHPVGFRLLTVYRNRPFEWNFIPVQF